MHLYWDQHPGPSTQLKKYNATESNVPDFGPIKLQYGMFVKKSFVPCTIFIVPRIDCDFFFTTLTPEHYLSKKHKNHDS